MPTSPKMGWNFPEEDQDPFYDDFEDMVNAMDASGTAAREDRNIVLMGGGEFSFDDATGEWVFIPGVVDTQANTVTFSIGHFTTFAILALAPVPEPTASATPSLTPTPIPSPTPTETPTTSGDLGAGAWAMISVAIAAVLGLITWLIALRHRRVAS